MAKRPIRKLVSGDIVRLEPEGRAMVTRARPAPEKLAVPFRAGAAKTPVPAWSVCWRIMSGERAGQIAQTYLDPDDSVTLA